MHIELLLSTIPLLTTTTMISSPSLQSLALPRVIGRFSLSSVLMLYFATTVDSLHHMKRAPLAYVLQRDQTVPLVVSNLCKETIHPGIATQAGTPPASGGFELQSGQTRNLTVGADWQGRVWGRTNCSFNTEGTGPPGYQGVTGYGVACGTGDCGGILDCTAGVYLISGIMTLRNTADVLRARHL